MSLKPLCPEIELRAVSQGVNQVEFIGGRSVDFIQLLLGSGAFQFCSRLNLLDKDSSVAVKELSIDVV
jgi:hypothetical protein